MPSVVPHVIAGTLKTKAAILDEIRRTPFDNNSLRLEHTSRSFEGRYLVPDLVEFFAAIPTHIDSVDLSHSLIFYRELHEALRNLPAHVKELTLRKSDIDARYISKTELIALGESLTHVVKINIIEELEKTEYPRKSQKQIKQFINPPEADIIRLYMGRAIRYNYRSLLEGTPLIPDISAIIMQYLGLHSLEMSEKEANDFFQYGLKAENYIYDSSIFYWIIMGSSVSLQIALLALATLCAPEITIVLSIYCFLLIYTYNIYLLINVPLKDTEEYGLLTSYCIMLSITVIETLAELFVASIILSIPPLAIECLAVAATTSLGYSSYRFFALEMPIYRNPEQPLIEDENPIPVLPQT